jgi:hypothetical protein
MIEKVSRENIKYQKNSNDWLFGLGIPRTNYREPTPLISLSSLRLSIGFLDEVDLLSGKKKKSGIEYKMMDCEFVNVNEIVNEIENWGYQNLHQCQ